MPPPAEGNGVLVRQARREDAATLMGLILELAEYERLTHAVRADADVLARSLFEERAAGALLAEVDGEAIGYAVFFGTFSTFEGRAGIWIEDLYVRPEHRGRGVGRALFAEVAALAVERGCPRVEWVALDWNELALGFYDRLGARPLEEWRALRLDGEALRRLAGDATAPQPGRAATP